MRACIITPFHDDRWSANASANVARLGLPAVFVLNGAARGFALQGTQIRSDSSHAAAMNAGMSWAREQGFDVALSCDSDDYYGAGYAEATLPALESADIVGRRQVFARLADGVHLFDRPGRSFLFATVAFRLSGAPPVRDVLDNCDDWCSRAETNGARLKALGPEHYLYRRHGGNAHWRLPSDVFVRYAWGDALFFGDVPDDIVSTSHQARPLRRARPTDSDVMRHFSEALQ